MDESCIQSLPKKSVPSITKKDKDFTFTTIAAKVCTVLFLSLIQPEVEEILREKSEWFLKKIDLKLLRF